MTEADIRAMIEEKNRVVRENWELRRVIESLTGVRSEDVRLATESEGYTHDT